MAEQEFLASFGVEIDESGVQRLRDALEQNRALAEELAAAFDRARESVQAFFSELSEFSLPNWDGSYAQVTEQQEGISIPFSLDFTKATQELNAFFKVASKGFRLNADGSGTFPWEEGLVLPSSVKYVHQKDAHLHSAVMETLNLPAVPFGEE